MESSTLPINNEAATPTVTMASRPVLHVDEVDKIYNPMERQMQLHSVQFPAIKLDPIIEVLDQLTDNFVRLPHIVSHRWHHVMAVLGQLALLSLATHALFLLTPIRSVNDGYDANVMFLRITMTGYQVMEILPWIETVHFAIPNNKGITIRARCMAVVVGIVAQKLFDLAITNCFWTGAPKIFPIPFSVLTTGILSGPFAMLTLFFMSTDRDEAFRAKFGLCQMLLTKYLISFLMGGLWAVLFGYLMGHWSQNLSAVFFAIIKFFCKLVLCQRQTTLLNSRKWVTLNLVVDIIFARVQVVTLPFIQSWETLVVLLVSDIITILWKLYNGADRVGVIGGSYWDWVWGKTRKIEALKEALGNDPVQITTNVLTAPLADVHTISIRLNNAEMRGPVGFVSWSEHKEQHTNNESQEEDDGDDDDDDQKKCGRQDTDNNGGNENRNTADDSSCLQPPSRESNNSSDNDNSDSDECIEPIADQSIPENNDDDCVVEVNSAVSSFSASHDDEEVDLESGTSNRSIELLECSCRPSSMSNDENGCTLDSVISRSLPSVCSSLETVEIDESSGSIGSSVGTSGKECKSICHSEDSDLFEPSSPPNELTISKRRAMFRQCRGHQGSDSHHKNDHSLLHEQIEEVTWEQRHLFHSVDTAASEVLTLIVELHSIASMAILRHLPIKEYLTEPFRIDDARFEQSAMYSAILAVVNALLLCLLALRLRIIRNPTNGRRVSLNRIMSYIFRDNFWFLCLWLGATGAMACSAMIQHFGADFSLKFEWLRCRETAAMAWPGCL